MPISDLQTHLAELASSPRHPPSMPYPQDGCRRHIISLLQLSSKHSRLI
jgi:hypothetical protein